MKNLFARIRENAYNKVREGGITMAEMNIKIAPSILRWIIQKMQFQNANSAVTDVLFKWQSGEKAPTFNQIQDVSKKCNIPFGYFFLTTPPNEECSITEFRTIDSLELQEPSRNLLDTVDAMTDVQEWMKDFLLSNGASELPFVGKCNIEVSKDYIAEDIRNVLKLSKDWFMQVASSKDSFKYLRGKCEEVGILVMMSGIVGQNTRRKLSVSEFRAFTLIDAYAPLIFINTCDSESGKLFSLLHELVHIWMGIASFYNDQFGKAENISTVEMICNAVTADILVPMEMFDMKWNELDLNMHDRIAELSRYFKCSQFVVARRALDSEFISGQKYTAFVDELTEEYKNWQERRGKKSTGGDFYKTMGAKMDHRFVRALESSAREGKTQYTDVYRLTNTNRKTFSKLISEIGNVRISTI